jgi:hypothetical protein
MTIEKLLPGNIHTSPSSGDFVTGTADAVGGRFWISRTAIEDLASCRPSQLIALRRRMWEANQVGVPLQIRSADLENITERIPSFKSRTDDLLDFIISHANPIYSIVPIGTNMGLVAEAMTILCTEDPQEIRFYVEYLAQRGFVRAHERGGSLDAALLPEAFIYAETERRAQTLSTRAFVAMWFGGEMNDVWETGIRPAIEAAGYEAFRIDKHEHVNRIDDEILAQIRNSRFTIADFTSEPGKPRGGVYFEAGFALGLDRPVIWTAHERMQQEIHFDTRQYNHIFWATPLDLREKLHNRIVALLGAGPVRNT